MHTSYLCINLLNYYCLEYSILFCSVRIFADCLQQAHRLRTKYMFSFVGLNHISSERNIANSSKVKLVDNWRTVWESCSTFREYYLKYLINDYFFFEFKEILIEYDLCWSFTKTKHINAFFNYKVNIIIIPIEVESDFHCMNM